MQNEYSVAEHWAGGFVEGKLQTWAEGMRNKLGAPEVTLGLVFMAPKFFPHAEQVLELLRVHARIPLLAGCSSTSLVAGDQELEDSSGLVLGLYYLPEARLTPHYFTQAELESATSSPDYWPSTTGVAASAVNGWLVFADPFNLDCEHWLSSWNDAYNNRPIVGGLASGSPRDRSTQIYLNGSVYTEGGVGIAFHGDVELASVISQGCTPIGEAWTITRAERNFIHEIANRPAYQVLVETYNGLPPKEQAETRGNLFVGLVIDEYQEEFRRGDFLIRNLMAADPMSGALQVGAFPRVGQTIQFQRRDAAASHEDMQALLKQAKTQLAERTVLGGCLCCCNGRGHHLFKKANHDAGLAQEQLGPMGLSGFFCNGEIGPIGPKNFLHGYTASLALFVKK